MVGPVLPYLKAKGVKWNEKLLRQKPFCQLSEYLALCDRARSIESDFVSLSYNSWLQSKNKSEVEEVSDVLPASDSPSSNRILYGPPGTGKTFSSVYKAVELIDGLAPENRLECQQRFHELRTLGQIGFVTFHQSFSYEEFVEGLRPVIKDDDGAVRYEIRVGVLKEMALTAISQSLKRIESGRATFEQLWNVLLEKVEDEKWLLPGIGTSQYKLTLTPSGNLTGENIKGNAQQPYNASRDKIERVWKELRDGPIATHALIIGILKVGSHSNLIGAVVEELKRIEKALPQSAIRSTSVEKSLTAATSFLAGSLDYRTDFQGAPKFVLIIDEINRGNVSKIFGELITLLEDDKRIGEPNELRVTLPTSGETFALPPNLYILGTMNTADRSLAQLDVALRRRFEFEELAPCPELCNKLDKLPEVLTALNERLEWALDREHRLGHAYFMDVDSEEMFNVRFRSKVVPLLIEYFPHDFATLRAVLGETSDGFLRTLARPEGFKGGGAKYRWWFETQAEKTFSAFEQLKSNFGI